MMVFRMFGFLILVVLIMCPNKDVFSTYKFIEGGVILMDNGMLCKILGIGIVKIKMHDGVLRT